MATLSAWKVNTLQGAGEALTKLEKLNRDFLINLHDEAVRFSGGACEHALRP